MNSPLSDSLLDEVHGLTLACLGGEATPVEVRRLEELLLDSEDARRIYADAIQDSFILHRWAAAEELRTDGAFNADEANADWFPVAIDSAEKLPDLSEAMRPRSSVLHNACQGTVSYFSQIGPLSYLIATVILCAMLLGAWAYKIANHPHIVHDRTMPIENIETQYVGRITGMNDCVWAKGSFAPMGGASVPMGRKYELSSGLMEVTYTSGARVILEGPCEYTVDSSAGGYLQRGKLTARVETKAEGGRRKAEKGSVAKSEPSSLTPHPSSLFTVTTPTAVVTDLGTEFGVEVEANGNTFSQVFQGSVEVMPTGGNASDAVLLGKNNSIRVEKAVAGGKPFVVRGKSADKPLRFVRNIPRPRRNYIDLADIVAGGDGFGRANQRGIDAVTGRVMADPAHKYHEQGEHTYHRVGDLPLIDGVFVPGGGQKAVQLDSAGHSTSVLTDTDNSTWNYIWSGQILGDEDRPIPLPAVSCWLENVNYAGRGHSVLSLPPNKGITFDIEAIRRANPDARITRFTTVAGNTEVRSRDAHPYRARVSADFWVFVDGELRFSKTDVNSNDGAFAIDVKLTPDNRFLTLVVTDGGNGTNFDWTIFGDPRLELESTSKASETRTPSANDATPMNRKGGAPMEQ